MDELDPMVLQDAHKVFDIKSANSKQFYKLLLSKKAKLPNMSKRLIADFDVEDMLEKNYLLPHNVANLLHPGFQVVRWTRDQPMPGSFPVPPPS